MVYQNISKGQAFQVILIASVSFSDVTSYLIVPRGQTQVTAATNLISKDGGAFVPTTNAGVFIMNGAYSLQLTASEMDADRIEIVSGAELHDGLGNKFIAGASIFTVANELTSAPTINSSIADKITAIFQYLFLKRTVTNSQEKLYKSDDTTILATGTLSDDTTTFTKGRPS